MHQRRQHWISPGNEQCQNIWLSEGAAGSSTSAWMGGLSGIPQSNSFWVASIAMITLLLAKLTLLNSEQFSEAWSDQGKLRLHHARTYPTAFGLACTCLEWQSRNFTWKRFRDYFPVCLTAGVCTEGDIWAGFSVHLRQGCEITKEKNLEGTWMIKRLGACNTERPLQLLLLCVPHIIHTSHYLIRHLTSLHCDLIYGRKICIK